MGPPSRTYLRQCQQQAANGSHHDAADDVKRDLLRPEGDVDVEPQPVDHDVHRLGHRVDLANTVEYNVYRTL